MFVPYMSAPALRTGELQPGDLELIDYSEQMGKSDLCIVDDQAGTNTHARTHAHTHTHLFNGPLSRTTQVCWYQKGKTNLDFTAARDSEWQWHQLGHMQVCTSPQTVNHASTPPLNYFYRLDALPATQPTASQDWRQAENECIMLLMVKSRYGRLCGISVNGALFARVKSVCRPPKSLFLTCLLVRACVCRCLVEASCHWLLL